MAAATHRALAVRSGQAPLVLAIECATSRPSAALLAGERVLALRIAESQASAAAVVLPQVDGVLSEAGVALGDVSLFAVTIGPGSFTGLRVGLATVKGLAFETDTPVAPVPTLAALCRTAGSAKAPVVALLDARRGEAYAAAYGPASQAADEAPEGDAVLLPEGLYAVSDLASRLGPAWRVTGDAASLLVAACRAQGRQPPAAAPGEPLAPAVGRLGLRLLAQGGARPAAGLVPHYLRRAEAEVRRTGERVEAEKPF